VRRKPLNDGSYLYKHTGTVSFTEDDFVYVVWDNAKATYGYPAELLETLDTDKDSE